MSSLLRSLHVAYRAALLRLAFQRYSRALSDSEKSNRYALAKAALWKAKERPLPSLPHLSPV